MSEGRGIDGQDARASRQALGFAHLVASASWALAGVALYTVIVVYVGWRMGVIEGAPLGGPLCEQAEPRS